VGAPACTYSRVIGSTVLMGHQKSCCYRMPRHNTTRSNRGLAWRNVYWFSIFGCTGFEAIKVVWWCGVVWLGEYSFWGGYRGILVTVATAPNRNEPSRGNLQCQRMTVRQGGIPSNHYLKNEYVHRLKDGPISRCYRRNGLHTTQLVSDRDRPEI